MLGTYTFNYRTDSLYSTDSFTANRKVGDRRAGLNSASKRGIEDLFRLFRLSGFTSGIFGIRVEKSSGSEARIFDVELLRSSCSFKLGSFFPWYFTFHLYLT